MDAIATTLGRRNALFLGAVLMIAVGVGISLACEARDNGSFNPAGSLDDEAVVAATGHEGLPILWLGEEFEGYRLAELIEVAIPFEVEGDPVVREAESVSLVYGACEPSGSGDSRGCVPPITITMSGPGAVPASVKATVAQAMPLDRARDVEEVDSDGWVWLENDVVVRVFATPGLQERAYAGLQSANHGVLGFGEILPGAPLAPASAVAVVSEPVGVE